MSAMATIHCGESQWHPAKSEVHELEIIPAENPGVIDKGDTIALKVLFQGKPLAGTTISPSAASHGKHDHGHGHDHNHGHETVETDADGIARIKLTADGSWLFNAKHETPYPNEALCDSFL